MVFPRTQLRQSNSKEEIHLGQAIKCQKVNYGHPSVWKSKWKLILVLVTVYNLATCCHAEQEGRLGPDDPIPKPFPIPERPKIMPCGTTKMLSPGEEVYIESPNFSNKMNYPNSVTCQWNFQFNGCRLEIGCPNFKLSDFLCFDYLDIQDGKGNVNRYCGSKGPSKTPLYHHVNITFRSSAFFSNLGFRCSLNCDELGDEGDSELNKPQAPPINCTCGVSSKGATKIIGGEPVEIGEFPWMAGLVRRGSSRPFCGGSLINNRYILTAAHCVSGRTPQNLEVLLNAKELSVNSERSLPIRKVVEAIIPHKSYTARLDYDAALIKMQEPVDFSVHPVLPVCLPHLEESNRTYEQLNSTVTGWGVVEESGTLSQSLLQANVTVTSNDECNMKYSGSITERMLCAAAPGKDACQGDSGGPLVHNFDESKKKFVQIGIVSWGHGCARPEKPGVYSRITEFSQWILRNTGEGNYCDK